MKFARWIQELEILAYEIKYVKVAENGPADFLSRISTDIDCEVNDEDEHFERHIYQISYDPDWLNKMKRCQEEDALVSSAISQLRDANQVTQGQFKNQVGMTIREWLLCRGSKVVIPRAMRQEAILLVHSMCHPGVDKTTRLVRSRFFWKRMDSDIDEYCRGCLICYKNKPNSNPKEKLIPISISRVLER